PDDTAVPTLSPDGKWLAFGTAPNEFVIARADTGKEARTITSDIPRLVSLVFSPDSKTLIGRSKGDAAFGIWETRTGQPICTVGTPSRNLEPNHRVFGRGCSSHRLAVSADGKTLASAQGNVVRLFDLTSGRELSRTAGHEGPI